MSAPRQTTDPLLASLQVWWRSGWLPAILLTAAVLLAYQPAWNAGFIWDDDRYVTRNPLLTAPDGLKRIWFSTDAPSQYCPLVYTVFRLEHGFWNLDPSGYHWVNILLHAANAVLLWRLLRRLEIPGAWLAAALFALHPVQVESVAWITELKNILSLLFCLLALLAWVDFVEDRNPKPWRAYALAIVLAALALLSKATACTLPAALLLVLWLKKLPLSRRRLAQVTPFVGLGLGMGLLTVWWERYHQGTSGTAFTTGALERILIASRAVWFYAGKLAWPANLTFSYPRWTIDPGTPSAYGWLLAGAAAVALIILLRKQLGRGPETAAAFYVATLSPLLGFIMLYTFRYSFVADHYQYVASIGPLALAGAAISRAATALGRKLSWSGPAVGVVLLLGLAGLTWRQCGMYADAETLWRTTIARNPASFLAHNNLATTFLLKGRTADAIGELHTALQLQPNDEIAHYDLGHALLRAGQLDEALSQFQKAVELKPDYAGAHNNLGNILLQKGQSREALAHYRAALKLRPKSPDIANNLAWLLATCPDPAVRQGDEALELALKAQQLSGGSQPVYVATLAAAYAETGLFAEAIAAANQAQKLAALQKNAALFEMLTRQLSLYQVGAAFRTAGPAATEAPRPEP